MPAPRPASTARAATRSPKSDRPIQAAAVPAVRRSTPARRGRAHSRLQVRPGRRIGVLDSSGNDHNGTISGGVTWVAGRKGNAIKLDGVNGFVLLPTGIVSALTDMTLATWVQLEVAADWQRIIDFGNNRTVQMFLVPQNKETGVMRFVLTTAGKAGQQLVNGPSPLPVGVWKHVAVVLKGATASLYVDGASVASMGGFTLHPSSMGSTTNSWIGRSQNSADPYFKGMFDDFRIDDRAHHRRDRRDRHELEAPRFRTERAVLGTHP